MASQPTPMSRRDRRKADARQRLVSAGRQAVAESGISGLRISDLTARADVGFGTFYSHFESKEDFVEAVVNDVLQSLATSIGAAAVAAEDPAVAASAAYRRFVRFAADEPELARVLVELDRANDAFETAVRPWATKILESGCASGRFDIEDTNLCLISIAASALAAIRAMLNGTIDDGLATGSRGAEMMLRAFGLDAATAREIAYLD